MKLYLYLAKRDKTGMKLLHIFPTKKELRPTRVLNLKDLALPEQLEKRLVEAAHTDRMLYDLWAESASSFVALKESLKKRGYTNLPQQQYSVHQTTVDKAKVQTLPQIRTMIKRGSQDRRT